MDVLMPQLGETVAEGKSTKWFKNAGDAVRAGDNLFEIETDKTSMEVPSTAAGTLTEIHFQVGEVAKVGAVVAVMLLGGGVLEQITIARARRSVTALLVSVPEMVLVRRGDKEVEMPVSELSVGDRVVGRQPRGGEEGDA